MRKPSNTLFIIFSLQTGGTQKMMLNVLNEITLENRKKVLFMYNYYPNPHFEEVLSKDVVIYTCSSRSWFKHLKRLHILLRIIRKEKIGNIVSFASQGAYLAILSRKIYFYKKLPIIYRMVSVDAALTTARNRLMSHINRYIYMNVLCKKVNIIVSQSIYMTQSLLAQNAKNVSHKIVTINNLLDTKFIQLKAKEPIEIEDQFFIYVGRLSIEKNITGIIQAFNKIQYQIKQKLLILGDGAERNNIEILIDKLNLKSKVILLGFKDNPYRYIEKATGLILFSEYEGLPNVILEAMTCNTLCIVSSFNGADEIISHNINGYIVEKNNIEQLSDAMLKAADESIFKKRLIDNANKFVKKLNEKSIHIYQNILS